MTAFCVHECLNPSLDHIFHFFPAGLTPLCLQSFLELRRLSRKLRTEAAVLSSISEKKAELSVKSPR